MNRFEIALGKEPPNIEPAPELMKERPKPGPSRDVNDPVVQDGLIQQCLQSAQGRLRLAASMTEPLQAQLNSNSFARRFLSMEQLPDGALPAYDKDRGVTAYTIAEDGQNIQAISRSNRVFAPLFEIASNPEISLSQMRQRPSESFNRARQQAFQAIRNMEEEMCLSLLAGMTNSSERNLYTNEQTLSRDVFTEAFSMIERSDLRVNHVLMNENHYSEMLGWGREFIDAQDHYVRRPDAGVMGGIWDATITTSRAVPAGEIYLLAEPQFVGHMPVRTPITVLSADNPERMTLGWAIFENIGMACLNPTSVVRVNLITPIETQFLASCVVGGRA